MSKSLYTAAILLCSGILLVSMVGCTDASDTSEEKVVAAVGDQKLYLSDIHSLVSAGTATGDSSTMVNTFVDQWLKKATVIVEAEKSLSPSLDIEKLVDDYRASLLLSNYRQAMVQSKLDTSVTAEQLSAEYENQQSNFVLAEPIVKALVAKVDREKPSLKTFMKDWRNGNIEAIRTYCEAHAEAYDLGGEWKSTDALKPLVPEGILTDRVLEKKGTTQKYKSGYEYFVKVLDVVDEGMAPPLDYIEDKIRDIIIHKRKKDLVAKLEQDIYNKALATNKVKVYRK